MDSDPIKIRKYPNRRYYDTSQSQHVTLDQICDLIKEGKDIQVTDSKTGEDITAKVLAQIILEYDSPKLDLFPVPLLLQVIRFKRTLLKDFVDNYFNRSLAAFMEAQEQWQEQLLKTPSVPPVFSSMSDWTRNMMTPFWQPDGPGSAREGDREAGSGEDQPFEESSEKELREHLDKLQKELAEIQSRLDGKNKT